jgi:hypothetical protein
VTTTRLKTPRRAARWLNQMPPTLSFAIALFIIAGGIASVKGLRSAYEAVTVPTPMLPIVIIASPLPLQPPTAVPAVQVAAVLPNRLRRAAVAYDSPNGNVIGAIEQGRAYQVLARFGGDWLQADVVGSGVVWLRSADVLDLPDGLVDLQPPPAPAVVYVPVSAPAPAYAAPLVEAAPTPATVYEVVNERQQNIQNRLIEIPTIAPMEMTDANAEWARQQWAAEHPEAGR